MCVEACFREYGDSMTRSMTSFSGDEQAAQDAVQQAFMKALAARAMLEQMPEPAMKAWLYAAARNALIDMKRKQSRLVYDVDENLVFDQPDPTDKLVAQSLMGRLPPDLRLPVYMKYFSQTQAAIFWCSLLRKNQKPADEARRVLCRRVLRA